jgi:NADH-quinone oxidoreductase subunit M
VITAAYILLVVRRVFFGELSAEFDTEVTDIGWRDKLAIGLLCALMIGLGVFPSLMVPMIQSGVNSMTFLGGM